MKVSRKSLVIIVLLLVVVFAKPRKIEAKKEEIIDYNNIQLQAMGLYEKWSYDIGDYYPTGLPTVADLDHDGKSEIIFCAYSVFIVSYIYHLYCLNSDGTIKWSRHLDYSPTLLLFYVLPTPQVIDTNQDGYLEVICVDNDNRVTCLDYNGSVIWHYYCSDIIYSSPSIADLDNDNRVEIIVSDESGIYCISDTGELEWYLELNEHANAYEIVLADIDGNGNLDILTLNFYNELLWISHTGVLLNSMTDCSVMGRSPGVTDINDDGKLEIIYQDINGTIICREGFDAVQWSIHQSNTINGPPVIADLDNDNDKEVIIKTDNFLLCFDLNGNLEWNYSRPTISEQYFSAMALADLDGDSTLEVVFIEFNDNNIYCLSHNGSIEWNYTAIPSICLSPIIADVDGDNLVEIFFGNEFGSSANELTCLGLTGIAQSGEQQWRTYQSTSFHTGNIDSDNDYLDDLTEEYYSTVPFNSDSDADQLLDGLELLFGTGSLDSDTDDDLLFDGEQLYTYKSQPYDSDTDDDFLQDGEEIYSYHTNLLKNDTDEDRLIDGEEIYLMNDGYITDPLNNDTDNDTLIDGDEVYLYLTNPTNIDSDSDGLHDNQEIEIYGTNPINSDTDQDGMDDHWELFYNFNPFYDDSSVDFDSDNLTNVEEYSLDTNPIDADSDDDSLTDGQEVKIYFTNPLDADSDGDLLDDNVEVKGIYSPSNPGANTTGYIHTNPLNPDTDNDTYIDSVEIYANTNPNDSEDYPGATTPPTSEEGFIMIPLVILSVFMVSVVTRILRKRRK